MKNYKKQELPFIVIFNFKKWMNHKFDNKDKIFKRYYKSKILKIYLIKGIGRKDAQNLTFQYEKLLYRK